MITIKRQNNKNFPNMEDCSTLVTFYEDGTPTLYHYNKDEETLFVLHDDGNMDFTNSDRFDDWDSVIDYYSYIDIKGYEIKNIDSFKFSVEEV